LAAHVTLRNHGFRAFAIGVTCSLAFAAITHLHLFDASEDAAGRSMRYDLAWTGANGRIEFANLEKYVARFMALGAKGDADAAQLFYDILRSRMEAWGSGDFRHFIENSPRRLAEFNAVRAKVEDLRADIEGLNELNAQRRLLGALSEIAPMIERIGAEAHTTSVAESAVIREDLRRQQQLQRWLIFALLASGAAVLAVTALQNRSLRAAHMTAARHAEASLFLARHDALTKLPNRPAFEAAYHAALQAKGACERIVIAAIDLDGFKSINDLLGHAAGDAVLVAVSKLLASEATRADPRNIVCRVGGDEFLALLWPSDEPASIAEFATRLLTTLQRPLETTYGAIMIGASVGIATSDVMPANDLIVNADLALTEAKARGKGIALLFEPGMLAGLKRRLRLEADLALAIDRGEFVPYYQPKIDLVSARLVGLEALARWHHPELGWVSPEEFIPVAESSGAIVKIGRLMLETACRDAAAIPGNIGISVNLSVVQILRDDIVDAVKNVLASTALAPARLTLEITESVMMTDPEKVIGALKQLKMLGVCISLDDFGTGYSALAYLTQFRWDELKIDRSFIGRAWSDPINLAIIKAIKMLAQQMNAKLTVEGVEYAEQCELLREIGCDTAQGYFFGRPLPLDELQPLLLRNLAASFVASAPTAPPDTSGARSVLRT
jgi:diguanylate cyclase (GGDEF)-like protein